MEMTYRNGNYPQPYSRVVRAPVWQDYPLEELSPAPVPFVKQRVPANFRYEPIGGIKKKSLIKFLLTDPLWRLVILAPFFVAFLMILEHYGLLPYQW